MVRLVIMIYVVGVVSYVGCGCSTFNEGGSHAQAKLHQELSICMGVGSCTCTRRGIFNNSLFKFER